MCHEGPGFSPYMCALPIDDLCIECSIFSMFFLSGTIQAFEIQKSHCESPQAGNNPFLYVCVCPKWMGGLQLVLPSRLLTEGTSLSRVLPFALFPGGRIPLDTLQHRGLYKAEKRQT